MATWVLGKGASAGSSSSREFSPKRPILVAPLLTLAPLSLLLTSIGGDLFVDGGRFAVVPFDLTAVANLILTPLAFLIVPIATIGILYRKRLRGLLSEMSYRKALSTTLASLGVLSYLAALLSVFALAISHRGGFHTLAGNVIAITALLMAAWVVKKELNEMSTRALRFGVPFSIVFVLVNAAVFVGLKALLKAAGI